MGSASRLVAIAVVGSIGVVTACDERRSPVEPTPVCTVAISPASRDIGEDGGPGAVTVTTAAGCRWTASPSVDWLVVTAGASGVGGGSIAYDVRSNPAPAARSATLTVEGQRHTVTQAGRTPPPCTFTLDPPGAYATKDATTGTFTVVTAAGCTWTATSVAPWVTVTAGSPATGSGTVAYAIARNLDYADRETTIGIGERGFVIRQAGDTGVPRGLNGVWNGQLTDFPGGRTFQMSLTMRGDRVTGRITGDGTGGGGFVTGVYVDGGPVRLEADFGDGKQYFDGAFDGADRVRGTSTYNLRPPVYRFDMRR